MAGAFQTAREIFDNPIWQNIVEFRLFFLIYGKATFTDGVRIGDIELKRGQWVRSYRNLQHDLEYIENNAIKRYSLATIKRAIDKLTKDGRLLSKTCEYGTLFEVVNYAKYQCLDNYANGSLERQRNGNETATKQQRNNNKNAKNGKNEIYSSIFEHWNSKNIIQHRKLSDKLKRTINNALKDYAQEEICKAIDNYAVILRDDKYFWSYKWTLGDFLQRGIDKFLTNACFENYKNDKKPPPGKNAAPQAMNFQQRQYSKEFYDKIKEVNT